jgi:hypothetical protein
LTFLELPTDVLYFPSPKYLWILIEENDRSQLIVRLVLIPWH